MFKEIIGGLRPWKVILDKLLSPIRGRFVLNCNFQTSKLKINLPPFYKECFDSWSEVNEKTPSCYEEIISEVIWNNKFLCYDKKSMHRRDILNLGFVKITDLILRTTPSRATSPHLQILNKDFSYEYYQFDSRRMAHTY